MARHVFSAEETACLETCDPVEAEGMFLTLWTLKEAYVKVLGTGLSHGLERFTVSADPPGLRADTTTSTDGAAWCFHGFDPLPGYRMALAVRAVGKTVTVRRRAAAVNS